MRGRNLRALCGWEGTEVFEWSGGGQWLLMGRD